MKKPLTPFLLWPPALALLFALLPTSLFAKQENRCPTRSDQVVVRFTYGSEKAAWVHAVTEQFNAEGVTTASGKRICVHAIPKGSGDSVNEIKSGGAGPNEVHATSPASDLYVNLINHEYQEEQGRELLKTQGFLVSSPVVIAAWESALDKLRPRGAGADGGEIGWADLFRVSQEDPNFRYGQTNPERSNSGLSALVAQFYAATKAVYGRQSRRLSTRRVAEPELLDFVKRVHDSVIHYGASTGFYAKKMREGGSQYADAVVIYESDVIQANNTIRDQRLGYPRLQAIYPSEGTFATNHPFAIVKRDWVDADEEEGAQRYFRFLMSASAQAQALQFGFRPSVPLDIDPKIYQIVWNSENGVKPFNAIHRFLAAPSGATITAIRNAFRQIKKDTLVALVMDKSGSMEQRELDRERGRRQSRMAMAIESSRLLADRLQAQDRVSLILYDRKAYHHRATPKRRPLSMDEKGREQLDRALDKVRPGGSTAMRDAINYAWDELCSDIKRDRERRAIRVIIVLTDGLDNASSTKLDKLVNKIGFSKARGNGGYYGDEQCKIPVFGIAFGNGADDKALKALSAATGGETKKGDASEITVIFQRFSDLL